MKSFKVDCKNIETSKLVQEHLFSIGYEGFAGPVKTMLATHLYACRDGSMACGSQEDYFQSNPAEELQIHEVFALKKEEEKPSRMWRVVHHIETVGDAGYKVRDKFYYDVNIVKNKNFTKIESQWIDINKAGEIVDRSESLK